MSQDTVEIPLRDEKIAYGILTGSWRNDLVVIVHGFNSFVDYALYNTAAQYFSHMGLSVLRFALYAAAPNGRRANTGTIDAHAKDLEDIIRFARTQGASSVHLIGHSAGAYTIVSASHYGVSSISLWDPSDPDVPFLSTTQLPYVAELDAYVYPDGIDLLLSRQYVESIERFRLQSYLLQWQQVPTLLVSAGAGILVDATHRYQTYLENITEVQSVEIPRADHYFMNDGCLELLLQTTYQWINRFY